MSARWGPSAVVLVLASASHASTSAPPFAAPGWPERIERERALAADDPAHQPRMLRGAPRLDDATFDGAGARIPVEAGEWRLGLAAIGRERALRSVDTSGSPEIAGPEVRIRRAPGVVEFWRSLASGLEQGVTIEARPPGAGALALEMGASPGLVPELASSDEILLRARATGELRARYAHLVVRDAAGERVPARLAVVAERIRIDVDDARARYPLLVDPLVSVSEEATLSASDGLGYDLLGCSVAMTADGTRVLLGAYYDDTSAGAEAGTARVFVRTGTAWAEEATLIASDGAMGDYLGQAVAISADGTLALVGAPRDDTTRGTDTGSARVFVRSDSTWTEAATLVASDGATNDQFGLAVALSADGTRAIVGAPADSTTAGGTYAGTVRVFLRSGSSWAEEATLEASGAAASDAFGRSVALSTNAIRLLVGVPSDRTAAGAYAGSARVFVRSGSSWTEEATLLAAAAMAGDGLGSSVALSADGSVALVGASLADTTAGSDVGSALVFRRTSSAWAEEATLSPSAVDTMDSFGAAVALSGDGTRAFVGASQDDLPAMMLAGTVRVFVRSGASWPEAATVVPADIELFDQFGGALAVSADGGRLAVGMSGDNTSRGTNVGTGRVFVVTGGAANGTACALGTECLSGFCTDDVCCESACGGTSLDCQACSAVLTGGASGTCALLAAAVAPTVTCRPAAGDCDAAEVCTSTSALCPGDARLSSATVCRPSATSCDVDDHCDGTSATCPSDAPAPASTTCRAPAGPCDAEERCDGASHACPGDARIPAGVSCGGSTLGSCASAGVCDGASVACPGATPRPAGWVCMPAMASNPCDVDDVCDGTSQLCPATFAPASTACGPAATDLCDAPDHCAGTSANCVAAFLAGVECRAARDVCDVHEVCSGAGASCPPDAILAAGVPCRTSSGPACDAEEICDGVSTACPPDVNTCARDASTTTDAGGTTDAASAPDASSSSPDAGPGAPVAGCACRASASTAPGPLPIGLALALALVVRLRVRRRPAVAA